MSVFSHLKGATRKANASAPAVTRGKAKVKPAGKVNAGIAKGILQRVHAEACAAGELRVVFGVTPDRLNVIQAVLTPLFRVAKNGALGQSECSAAHKVTGAGRLRHAVTGDAYALGLTVLAPTAGTETAKRASWCALVGDGLTAPVVYAMSGPADGPTFRTADTETVMVEGERFSFSCTVRVPRAGDRWSVPIARVFEGGALPDTDAETLALAALDAREAGEAALIEAADMLTGAIAVDGSTAVKRATVTRAKRAAVTVNAEKAGKVKRATAKQ